MPQNAEGPELSTVRERHEAPTLTPVDDATAVNEKPGRRSPLLFAIAPARKDSAIQVMKIAMANSQRGEGGLPVIPRRPLHSLSVANAHRCRDTRAGQFRVPWREESIEMRPSNIAPESGGFVRAAPRTRSAYVWLLSTAALF